MATRLLPARLFSPRFIPPRLAGGSSAAIVQTATHLALTIQPGGAVSGVPLTIQPAGQALDAFDALVTDFGGTITAAVSSGTATITAGGTVSAASGGFQFTGLTLTGPAGLVTVTFSSGGLTPVTSATFLLAAAPTTELVLVDSPTRLTHMRRKAKTGDTVVITDTLMGYDRTPQSLPTGSSVVLNLKDPAGTLLVARSPATILESGSTDVGRVTVTVPASTNIPAGVSTYELEATLPDGSILTFPDDVNAELVVIPQIG